MKKPYRPRFQNLDARLMFAADVIPNDVADKGTEVASEQTNAKDQVSQEAGESQESSGEEGTPHGEPIDPATLEQLAEMSVDVLFGTDVQDHGTEDALESEMEDLISLVASQMTGVDDWGDAIVPMEEIQSALEKNNIGGLVQVFQSLGQFDMGELLGNQTDQSLDQGWLSPSAKTGSSGASFVSTASSVVDVGTKGSFAGTTVLGGAAGAVDVGYRVVDDIDKGRPGLGTGVAIVGVITATGAGAAVGGPIGAAIGFLVGIGSAIVGSQADAADEKVDAKNGVGGEEKTETSQTQEEAEQEEAESSGDNSPVTPKDGPSFDEQLRLLRELMATSPAFRQTMAWLNAAKAAGNIDPPPQELLDLGDALLSDVYTRDGLVNPGSPATDLSGADPSVPPQQGGDIDFGPDVQQSFESNTRPGESDVPSDVGLSDDTVSLPTDDDNIVVQYPSRDSK